MRCKYHKKCEDFDSSASACNSSGDYYGLGRKCGGYREFEKNE